MSALLPTLAMLVGVLIIMYPLRLLRAFWKPLLWLTGLILVAIYCIHESGRITGGVVGYLLVTLIWLYHRHRLR